MYFVVMPWLNHIVIIIDMYWNFICQLPACNLFTQHVSYLIGETPLVNCGPRSILLHLNTFYCFYCSLQTNTIFHSIRLILCFQQAGEIDNLTVTLGQTTLIVLCRFHVGAGFTGVAPHYTPPPTTFTWPSSPTGSITLVSYWGKTCCCTHHTFLLGFPTDVCFTVTSRLQPSSSMSAAVHDDLKCRGIL